MTPQYRLRPVQPHDLAGIEQLHDLAFGPGRFAKTAYRIREGLPAFSPLCRLAEMHDGGLAAAVRMAPIAIGDQERAQLLGPLAVFPPLKGKGIGKAVAADAIVAAREAGERLVLLVGDLGYYGRFGFNVAPAGRFELPGPVNPARLLYLELVPGALSASAGIVRARHARAS